MSNAISLENLQSALAQNKAFTDAKYDGYLDKIDDINLRSMIGEELDYGYFGISKNQSIINNSIVNFDTKVESLNMDVDNGYVSLKKGITYDIECLLYTTTSGHIIYNLLSDIDDVALATGMTASANANTSAGNYIVSRIFKPSKDCKIYIKLNTVSPSPLVLSIVSPYLMVREMGRTYAVDPMDVKEKHVVEYGMFMITNKSSIPATTPIVFDKVIGNIPLVNGGASLKGGKTYTIIADSTTPTGYGLGLYNLNSKKIYGYFGSLGTSVGSSMIYEPLVDCEVSIVCSVAYSSNIDFTRMIIQEIAQPVVVEYNNNKEISNPLTNGEISQESPIGSVISYIGLTAPDHYLVMDGSIYNIEDYQYLATHFKDKLGSINYYGGDGITTFAVPDARGEFTRGYDSEGIRDKNSGIDRGIGKHQNPTEHMGTYYSLTPGFGTYHGSKAHEPINNNHDAILTSSTGYFSASRAHGTASANHPALFSSRPTNINVLYCIKYEPTYYAVNQYGGFESKVLLDGVISSDGTFLLIDDVDNYDYLVVYNATNNSAKKFDLIIPSISNSVAIGYALGNNTSWYTGAYVSFNKNVMTVSNYSKAGWTAFTINKVIGYKGQLPTLLQGGVF